MERTHYIDGKWIEGSGDSFQWQDSSSGTVTWEGRAAASDEVDLAFNAAHKAFGDWAWMPYEKRLGILQSFRKQLERDRDSLAQTISADVGKPIWESRSEIDAMIGKINLSRQAYEERCQTMLKQSGEMVHATRFKPHGVTAVLSPFNLPGHLSHAHIVPALLAGNTVVFKPSEQAPNVAQRLAELWHEAGIPRGAFNLIQGGKETAHLAVGHPKLSGLYFTGGFETGKHLHQVFAGHPDKILALEMGGNNPLAVWEVKETTAAAYSIVQSAFMTSGQRCTCARRLILPEGHEGDRLLDRLVTMTRQLAIGPYTRLPEPFMGPLISHQSQARMLATQESLQQQGAEVLLSMSSLDDTRPLLSPGIVDVTRVADRPDEEFFGPLLQVIRVSSLTDAIHEANRTAFGLAAGLLSDRRDYFEQFLSLVRAGIINWNRPTIGASGTMPFGGVGLSGNHRPSGYYAADYCSFPVATTEGKVLEPPESPLPGISL